VSQAIRGDDKSNWPPGIVELQFEGTYTRVNTPICVGEPKTVLLAPFGKNRTLYRGSRQRGWPTPETQLRPLEPMIGMPELSGRQRLYITLYSVWRCQDNVFGRAN
jgi:hypothetical protein